MLAHRDAVTKVSPWMYGLATDGQIDMQYPTGQARRVAAIVALVQRHDYAGVDSGYENLHAGDRQAFSTFVRDLAAALHAHGKLVSVAVFDTGAVAGLERQPRLLLLLAVFFPFMRMLDAAISLYSVPAAWLSVSNGRWKSPARRPVGGATTASLPAAGLPASGAYHAGIRDEPVRPARVAEASHVSG